MKIFSIALVLFLIIGLEARMFAQDPVKLSPDIYKVLLENDHVRVLDIRLKPGDKSSMHAHPDSVVYALGAGTVKFTTGDGKTNEVNFKPGECLWRPAETHQPQNVGQTEVRAIQIELKR